MCGPHARFARGCAILKGAKPAHPSLMCSARPCSRSGAWRLYGTNVSIRCGHGRSAPEFVRACVAISAPSRDVAPADTVMKSAHYPPWPLGTNTDALAYVARSSPAAQLLFASGGPFRRVCFFETSTPLLAPLDFRAGHPQRASD